MLVVAKWALRVLWESSHNPSRGPINGQLPNPHFFVLPDSDPAPTVGRGPGAATTQFVSPDSDRGPTQPSVMPAKCRRAGLRSGTHGGARAGRGYHHTIPCTRVPTTPSPHRGYRLSPARRTKTTTPVLPDSDPVPTVGRGPGAATTRTGVSCGRPMVGPGRGYNLHPIRLPRLRSGAHPTLRLAGVVSSCRRKPVPTVGPRRCAAPTTPARQ